MCDCQGDREREREIESMTKERNLSKGHSITHMLIMHLYDRIQLSLEW